MKAMRGEFLPPRGQFAGCDGIECRPRLVNRRMTGREPTDRVDQIFLLSRDRQNHRSQLSSPRMRAALPYRNFGHTSSFSGTLGSSLNIRSSDRPIGKYPA